jgi:hypothetical protein
MIKIKVDHNLDEVLDYINSMQNDIQMIVAEATQLAYEDVRADSLSTFGRVMENASFDFSTDGNEFVITIDNINGYHLYNATGDTFGSVEECVSDIIQEKIRQSFIERGYDYGD